MARNPGSPTEGASPAELPVTVAELKRANLRLWNVTIRNPFVDSVKDGSLPREAFLLWLVHARNLYEGGFALATHLLQKAPAVHRRPFLEGLRFCQDELEWFDRVLAKRQGGRSPEPHPIYRAFRDYLLTLAFEPYVAGLTALWALLKTQAEAWSGPGAGGGPYAEYTRHFAGPGSRSLARTIARFADEALATSSSGDRKRAEAAFRQVVRYKLSFWVAALSENAPARAVRASRRGSGRSSRPPSRRRRD